jgi:hypothetical protein
MLATPTAAAQADSVTRSAARQLGYAGLEAFEAKDYVAASDDLERAFRLLSVPTLGLWSARALERSGDLVRACARYTEVTALPKSPTEVHAQERARIDAANELLACTARLPSVEIVVVGVDAAGVALTVDGVAVGPAAPGDRLALNPGTHHVLGVLGSEKRELDESLVQGDRRRVVLEFLSRSAAAKEQPTLVRQLRASADKPRMKQAVAPFPPAAVGFAAVGVAALGVGVYFAFDAHSRYDTLRDTCAPKCSYSDANSVRSRALTSDILTGTSVVAFGAAAFFYFGSRPSHDEAALAAVPQPGGGQLRLKLAF